MSLFQTAKTLLRKWGCLLTTNQYSPTNTNNSESFVNSEQFGCRSLALLQLGDWVEKFRSPASKQNKSRNWCLLRRTQIELQMIHWFSQSRRGPSHGWKRPLAALVGTSFVTVKTDGSFAALASARSGMWRFLVVGANKKVWLVLCLETLKMYTDTCLLLADGGIPYSGIPSIR